MRWRAPILVLIMLLFSPADASQASLAEIERREQAVVEAWQASPLIFRSALIVANDPEGFGLYEPRPDSVFRPNDVVIIYAEPVGYGWSDAGDGRFGIKVAADLLLKARDGTIIGGKENALLADVTSHSRNREFFIKLTITLKNTTAGDYDAAVTVHDVVSGKSGNFELPFSVK